MSPRFRLPAAISTPTMREAHGDLVGDDLRRRAHRAEERVLGVRGPAGEDDAVHAHRGERQHVQQPRIDVRERLAPATTESPPRSRSPESATGTAPGGTGTCSPCAGITISLNISLTTSANGCARPGINSPDRRGSGRGAACIQPMTLRSAQRVERHDEDEADDRPSAPARAISSGDRPVRRDQRRTTNRVGGSIATWSDHGAGRAPVLRLGQRLGAAHQRIPLVRRNVHHAPAAAATCGQPSRPAPARASAGRCRPRAAPCSGVAHLLGADVLEARQAERGCRARAAPSSPGGSRRPASPRRVQLCHRPSDVDERARGLGERADRQHAHARRARSVLGQMRRDRRRRDRRRRALTRARRRGRPTGSMPPSST